MSGAPSAGEERLGVLGYGRFGRALAEYAAAAGVQVAAWDPVAEVPAEARAATPADLAARSDIVVLAVPVGRTEAAAASIRPGLTPAHLVLDAGSVKIEPMAALRRLLGGAVPWAGTHPLFGPTSLLLGERPLRVVVCADAQHPGAAARARAFFEAIGCRVLAMDAEEHDRLMAETHALAYFVAKGMLDAGVPTETEIAPPSYQGIERTIEAVRSDAAHLFAALQLRNPFAAEARRRLLAALTLVDRDLQAAQAAKEEPGAAAAVSGSLVIADLGARSPELRATRDLIDAVDRDLVALLARRAVLSRRAGETKATLGHGVRDPARETALLRERRAWALEAGLDAEAIEDVFLAVLRGSRRVQEERPPDGDGGA